MVNKEKVLEFLNKLINEDDYKELFLSFVSNESDFESFVERYKSAKFCLKKDLSFFLESDPAADSIEEIEITYPGYKAIEYYRIAHILYDLKLNVVARIISEQAHFLTGIDIHPGAQIGCPFFIDHGTGVVIGETTIIGDFVKIYQGVTLGALSLKDGAKLKGIKRHPTIGNNVIIYAGTSILGGEVTIGDNTTIGSNVFLLKSIPSNCKVTISEPKLEVKQN